MKQSYRIVVVTLILATMVLSACGANVPQDAGPKVQADVLFTGIVESINGTQWVVNGQTFTVDPSVVRDRAFKAGDTVKVEGTVQSDGTLVVTRVEIPDLQSPATAPANPVLDDNSNSSNSNMNSNTNDANINDDNTNNSNSNDSNINGSLGSDDNSNTSSLGGNTNDDHSRDVNSNDDHGGQGSSGGTDDGGGHDSNDDNSNGG